MKNEVIIKDMRPSFGAELTVKGFKVYFAGAPIESLIRNNTALFPSAHTYSIVQYGTIVGQIALTEQDYKIVNDLLNPIDFTRVKNDVNGSPRFVCHFLNFIGEKDKNLSIDSEYSLALKRAKQLGGRKFHNKQYGGGIVFQMYDGQQAEMSQKIRDIANNKNK